MRVDPRVSLPVGVLAVGAICATLIVITRPSAEVSPPAAPRPAVRVMEIEPRTVRHTVRTHGTVTPRTESDLTAEVSGRVTWISPNLVSGGFIDEGEALLRIDEHDYEIALDRARAALTRSESQVKLTAKELARQRNLAGRSVASEANLDAAINAERAAQAGLREARANLAQAELDLARTEIVAPYEGRVREESVDVGQFVTRGSPIARLYAVDYAEVRLPVPDDQLAFLDVRLAASRDPDASPGAEVELRADFVGARRAWRGRIVRTEGEIDPRTRMVHVVARVEDPYQRKPDPGAPRDEPAVPLAVGLFVEAEIQGREAEDVVVLPRSSLREGSTVYVVDDEERLRVRAVDVLRAQGDRVFIAEGLRAGERVCTSPLEAAVDGMHVRVVGPAAGATS